MAPEVLIRSYTGDSQADAAALYGEDALKLADDGWIAISLVWVETEWPRSAYLRATILVIVVIGIGLLIWYALVKPKRTLMVTYERRVDAPESGG